MSSNQLPTAGGPFVDGTGQAQDPNASGTVPQSKLDQVRQAAVDSVQQGAEYPKMVYPNDKDGNCDWSRGVTVHDELDEKRQLSVWADKDGKKAAEINGEAEKRRKDAAKERLEAEAKATKEAAENRAKAGKGGTGDGLAEHTATEQAAAELLAPKVGGESGSPAAQAQSQGASKPAAPAPAGAGKH